MNTATYQFHRVQLGSLQCGIVRPRDEQCQLRSVAVFCHGFGAGGDDLVGLASEILQIAAVEDTMLVFPAAPLSLEEQGMPGGRAWWLLSIQRLISAMEDGNYEQVREDVPPGIDEAREMLVETIGAALDMAQLDESRLLLGGFSQGAMLSVDTALRGLSQPPAKLCLYSGCLICERQWKAEVSKLKSTQIFQSHGRLDPVLPLQTGLWLRDMIQQAQGDLDFVEFNGVHTIPMEAVEHTAHMLAMLSQQES